MAGEQSARQGVYSSDMLRAAVDAGIIRTPKSMPVEDKQFQPASLDLRLGGQAYRLRSSFLPGANARVSQRLDELKMGDAVSLENGAVLERGRPYLVRLVESVALPGNVRGRANPRSSTGRLDIFTRVITDFGVQFDSIPAGYRGPLWLEVYSNTFTVSVTEGLALAQLRLSADGRLLERAELSDLHQTTPLIFHQDEYGHSSPIQEPNLVDNGLFVSVSLPKDVVVGFHAKRNSGLLDLTKVGHYDAADFWDTVVAERGQIILHPEEFYLLISRERLSIPPTVASEMVAYDPTNGELRTHYAGFFDPGFGYSKELSRGTRAVLEVRAHDVPFMLEDGQPVARMAYEWMSEAPTRLYGDASAASHFQDQWVALSRQFKPVQISPSQPSLFPSRQRKSRKSSS